MTLADVSPAARMYRDALRVMQVLAEAGHGARLAGGCVRDRILGRTPADFDVATTAPPQEVIALLKSNGRKVVPTGLEHGTVTVVMPAGPIEVTTLRVDLETDGRHATVAFGTSFEADAERRDFTINAMFEDADGHIDDYFGGRADLAAGVLRFVGAADQRIAEDYLRILRCFRFQARFGYRLGEGTLEAITAGIHGLARVSQERITAELWKTLAGEHAVVALGGLRTSGAWARILPELASRTPVAERLLRAAYSAFAHLDESQRAEAILVLHFAAGAMPAFSDDMTTALAVRMRLPSVEARRMAGACAALVALTKLGDEVADHLELVDQLEAAGGEGSFMRFYVPLLMLLASPEAQRTDGALLGTALGRVEATELTHKPRRIARLPVDGKDLMQSVGVPAGPDVGRILATLRRQFRNGAWTTRDEALVAARALFTSSN